MKIAILPAVLVCFTVVSHAQEGAAPPELTESTTERYVSPEDRSFLKSEPAVKEASSAKENGNTSKATVVEKAQKQSTALETKAIKSKTEKTSPKVQQPEEEDVLSFNFLYYLFQRFKSTDLSDQK